MPSFDVTSEASKVEINNAIDAANKEIRNRFDFKGSDARVELNEMMMTIFADDDFKLGQVYDVLINKFAKRSVDVRFIERGPASKIGGDKIKEDLTVKNGISKDLAKKIIKSLKDKKLKVKASIQGETLRVASQKKDILQEAIQVIKDFKDQPLQFGNFRD